MKDELVDGIGSRYCTVVNLSESISYSSDFNMIDYQLTKGGRTV